MRIEEIAGVIAGHGIAGSFRARHRSTGERAEVVECQCGWRGKSIEHGRHVAALIVEP